MMALQTAVQSTPLIDSLADAYRIASRAWLARLVPIARETFTVLAGIEIGLSGLVTGGDRVLLNYIVEDDGYVTDRLFERAVLEASDGKRVRRVEIVNDRGR